MRPAPRFPGLILDLVLAAVGFAVLGVIGALVWHQVVDLPHYTRTAKSAEMDGLGLENLFAINGWFCVIGAVLGLLGAVGLLLWRHREPVWVLVVSVWSSILAALVMIQLGGALGPEKPGDALRGAKAGATAPVQLMLQGVPKEWYRDPYLYAWPAGAILGATLVLLFVSPRSTAPAEPVSTAPAGIA